MRGTKAEKQAARRAVDFIEQLTHTTGEWAGLNFALFPWQRKLVQQMFGTLTEEGYRQFRLVYCTVAKKNGKSELAAAIALKCLFADREPAAEVYSAACDRQQAGIVFRVAAQMVRNSPELASRCKVLDSVKRIVVPATGSFYQVLSSDVGSKHGLNAHAVIFDELHAQPNRDLWDVLTHGSGEARRQPLVFACTTAGNDHNSIGREVHEYALKVQSGVVRDASFLPVIYSVPDEVDWEDESHWKDANPSLGKIIRLDRMRDAYHKAKEHPAEQNVFRQLRLNQWVRQSVRYIDLGLWDENGGDVDLGALQGRTCYAGLDLASTTDIAALVLVFPPTTEGGAVDVLCKFYVPQDTIQQRSRKDNVAYSAWAQQGFLTATPGNVTDYGWIRNDLRALADQYHIAELAFDPWNASHLAQLLEEDGFTMVKFAQNYSNMSPATQALTALLLKRELRHGGNPVLRWMADNLVVKMNADGNYKPDKQKSTEKIDGIVALCMGLDRAMRHKDIRSVYESRGLRAV